MVNIDVSQLLPGDIQAALRSYPRRFEALLSPIEDEDQDEIAHRVGPDGRSAITILSDLTRTWIVLHEALRRITITDTPVVHAAVVDTTERVWEAPPPETVGVALELLTDEAHAFGESVQHVPVKSWDRTGTVADNSAGATTVTALGVAKEAVRIGREALGDVETTLRAVRR